MDCKRIYFIRHGERADYATDSLAPKYDVSFDPCLTYCGQVMAHKVGDYLKRTLPPGSQIELISSPMLRCLETSCIILQALDSQIPIKVSTYICEELLSIQYAFNPTPGLLLRTKAYDQIKIDHTRGYDFIDDKVILNFPESMDETTERYIEQFKKIEKECKHVTLVVSHGRGVNEFMEYYDPGNQQWNSKYCSLSMVQLNSFGKWEFKLKDYTEHLNTKYVMINSESEGEGCPDKVCDYISDCIIDACICAEKSCYANINAILKNKQLFIIGESSCTKPINYEQIARNSLKNTGYTSSAKGLNCEEVIITVMVSQTSDCKFKKDTPDGKQYPTGNQGTVSGYATNEWDIKTLMPFSHYIATQITKNIDTCRKNSQINGLLPYCKTQVAAEYRFNKTELKPNVIKYIAICVQHDHSVEFSKIQEQIIAKAITPALPSNFVDKSTKIVISSLETPFYRLTGMTGRKIISDTYGGWGKHICGAYSGKCPSKIERSGSYFCRFIAKNLVARKLCSRVLVQLTFAGGIKEPLALNIYTYGTVNSEFTDRKLAKMVQRGYCLELPSIIKILDLERPIYSKTSVYGHYGRLDPDFNWEKIVEGNLVRTDSI